MSTHTFRPDRMDRDGRDVLLKRVGALQQRIFDDSGSGHSFSHYLYPDGARTVVKVQVDSAGQPVGFLAVHRYRFVDRGSRLGRRIDVFRAEAGKLPEFRGDGSTARSMILYWTQHLACHPLRHVYYFGTLVDPSSYRGFCAYALHMSPDPHGEAPTRVRELVDWLIAEFDLKLVRSDPYPLVEVGWRTRESTDSAVGDSGHEDSAAAFFCAVNPCYRQGVGLPTVVALRKRDVLLAAGLYAFRALWRRFRTDLGKLLTTGED